MDNRPFGVVILAAGASTRLGRAKQLVAYQGTTLVEHAVKTALSCGAAEVIVVVGAESDAVKGALAGMSIRFANNLDWAEGMGGSIRSGVEALSSGIECAVIALCDQPKMTAEHLRGLADRHFQTGSPIVCSSYDGVKGAPSAFGASLFHDLKSLKGDAGARDLIRNSPAPVETVTFEGGDLDVDSEEDVSRMNQGK